MVTSYIPSQVYIVAICKNIGKKGVHWVPIMEQSAVSKVLVGYGSQTKV